MDIYIRRVNEKFGPYSREAVIEYVRQGVLRTHDQACYTGLPEWKPLGDLLGIQDAPGEQPQHITEFDSSIVVPPTPWPRRVNKGLRKLLVFLPCAALIIIVTALAYHLAGSASQTHRITPLPSAPP
jgi:hypothetical protein